jgi:hypothetical protein
MVAPEKRLQALTPPRGATRAPAQAKPEAVESYGSGKPGDPALQGDDYPLEYYEDGYPKLPACLDRRALKAKAAMSGDHDIQVAELDATTSRARIRLTGDVGDKADALAYPVAGACWVLGD